MSARLHARFATAAALAAVVGCNGGETPSAPAVESAAVPAADAEALRAAPTPRFPDGRPNLNGTWAHAGGGVFGLDFVEPERLPDGSVCVFGCDAPEESEQGAEGEPAYPETMFPPPELQGRASGTRRRAA